MHLLMDGFGGACETLSNQSAIEKLLAGFPQRIGMQKIHGPHVLTWLTPDNPDWGITGVVVLAESHISIHTFPARLFANIDVFSCRAFDADLVLNNLKEYFIFEAIEYWVVNRGLEYTKGGLHERGKVTHKILGVLGNSRSGPALNSLAIDHFFPHDGLAALRRGGEGDES